MHRPHLLGPAEDGVVSSGVTLVETTVPVENVENNRGLANIQDNPSSVFGNNPPHFETDLQNSP